MSHKVLVVTETFIGTFRYRTFEIEGVSLEVSTEAELAQRLRYVFKDRMLLHT